MCIKRIYFNTYGDGTEDVTERLDTCRRSKTCSHPDVRTYERKFRFTKLRDTSTILEPPSSLADRRPTPYHVDLDRARLTAALPPTPRASKSPSPETRPRRRAHFEEEVLGGRSWRKQASPSPTRHRHHRYETSDKRPLRRQREPRIVFVDDEPEAHRQRREYEPRGARAVFGNVSHRTTVEEGKTTTPRTIRWQDQVDAERAAQNARIASRSKGTAAAVHQHPAHDVKGILKKPNSTAATAGSADPYDELRRAVFGMDIKARDGERGRRRHRQPREDDAYWDRLRGRFDHRVERESKRRLRVVYADEGGCGKYL